MTRSIAITSGKGGVGKTVIGVNLALRLAQLDRSVCLFDGDLGLANVNILLKLYPEFTLEDVLEQRKTLAEIIMHGIDGIDIIPGSSGLEAMANLPSASVRYFLKSIAGLPSYDFAIFDTSSGIQESTLAFALASDEIVLVVTPDPTSLLDGYAVLKVLSFNEYHHPVRLIVNRCESKETAQAAYQRIKGAAKKHLGIDIVPLGLILEDDRVEASVRRQQPLVSLHPDSPASRCLSLIARRIIDHKPDGHEEADLTTFWSRYLRHVSGSIHLSQEPSAFQPVEAPSSSEPPPPEAPPQQVAEADEDATPDTVRQPESIPTESPEFEPSPPSPPDFAPLPEPDRASIEEHIRGMKPRHVPDEPPSDFIHAVGPCHLFNHPNIHDALMDALLRHPNPEANVTRLVYLDPGLAVSALKLARRRSVGTDGSDLETVVQFLGLDVIRNVTVAQTAAMEAFRRDRTFMTGLTDFWRHSVACAVLSGLIAKAINLPSANRAYLCGLLHDIGRLALASAVPDADAVSLHSGLADITPPTRHGQFGADLMQAWGLPSFFADTARYHHENPDRIRDALPLLKVVYAANALVSRPETEIDSVMNGLSGLLRLPETKLVELIAQAAKEMQSVAENFNLDWTTPVRPPSPAANPFSGSPLLDGYLFALIHSHELDTAIAHTHYSLEILFGSVETIFFIFREEDGSLHGRCPKGRLSDANLDDLVFQVDSRTGLAPRSFRENRIVVFDPDKDRSPGSLTDEILMRLMNKPALVCLPLSVYGRNLGVLAVGVEAGHAVSMVEKDSSMVRIADLAALALDAERIRRPKPESSDHDR